MKKRYLYVLLFGVPGLAVSLTITFAVFGALAGLLWIYVYGDEPWPRSAGTILSAFFILVFLVLWISSLIAGFITGKRLEETPGLNRNHLLLSAGATILTLALIILHQFGVGNIGPESDSVLCSEFCRGRGYPASSMPPKVSGARTCRCLDGAGQIVITESMGSIDSMQ